MLKAYKDYWNGYVDFTGTTSVGGYWWAVLANFIVSFLISLLSNVLPRMSPRDTPIIPVVFLLLCLLPSLAIAVRRLRDAGYAWTNIFWPLVPIAGSIILILRLCKPTSGAGFQAVAQQVDASGAPMYRSYAQPATQQQPYAPPTPPAPKPMAQPNVAQSVCPFWQNGNCVAGGELHSCSANPNNYSCCFVYKYNSSGDISVLYK